MRIRWRYRLLAVYLFLLALSSAVRWLQPDVGDLLPGQARMTLAEWDRDQPTGDSVQLAYRDIPAAVPGAPVLVLLHGSPMGSRVFDPLIAACAGRYRLIVPDLVGFGGSSLAVADYSSRTHAHNVVELLNRLGIARAQMLGYRQGGAVILNVADLIPARVESLTMLAAVGAQEVELLGDYTLNHGLYGLQLGVLWAAQTFMPHFGYMDAALLNVAYARNSWDSDQRPLRKILQQYSNPMLIVQGRDDRWVPALAAREHARLVPQSEVVWLDGGHLLGLNQVDAIADALHAFQQRLLQGQGKSRDDVPEVLQAAALQPMPAAQRRASGWGSLFYGTLLVLGTQVSEDFTCIAGGVLASRGVISFGLAVMACFLGIFIGDIALYVAGYCWGRPALRRRPLRWFLSERAVLRFEHWFHRRGAVIIVLARFVPGTRLPAYFTAGVTKIPLRKFLGYFVVAAGIWTPILVGLAFTLGDRFMQFFESFEGYAWAGLLAFAVFFVAVNKGLVPLLSWRGRRMLLSTWRRWTRWEFWPMWLLYPPVIVYVLYLGIRHRGFTLFTAVNPAMPESGFVEESKSAILRGLGDNGGVVARWEWVPVEKTLEAKLAQLDQFMQTHNLAYPIVLKPDVGQRGEGVAVVHERAAAVDFLRRCPVDVILQRYVDGVEYGVFYYRHPNRTRGAILGITAKEFTQVVGDGEHTLEWLILNDARAVCMAPFFLDKHAEHLDRVPSKGEPYRLVDLGTHCRGSVFKDGADLLTDALTAEMERISQRYSGFYFGRYDIKVPSAEHLRKGNGIQVIELNGVTSEATFIYDPQHSVVYAWQTLCRQWRLAFEIAAVNRAQGAKVASLRRLSGLLAQRHAKNKFEA